MIKYIRNNKNIIFYIIIVLLFILSVVWNYYGIIKYDYQVPSGGDAINRINDIIKIQETGKIPKGYGMFNTLIYTLYNIFDLELMTIFIWFYPFIALLPFGAIYYFSNRYFNKKIVLLSIIFYLLFTKTIPWYLNDGTVINIIAADFLLIINYAILIKLLSSRGGIKKNLNYFILFIIFNLSIANYHNLSNLYNLALSSIYILFFVIHLIYKKRRKQIIKTLIIQFTLLISSIITVWGLTFKNYVFPLFKSFANSFLNLDIGNNIQSNSIEKFYEVPNNYLEINDIYIFIGKLTLIFLILFFIILLPKILISKNYLRINKLPVLFLVLLFTIFSILSQQKELIITERLVRELFFPATIFASLFTYYVFVKINSAPKIYKIIFIFLTISLLAMGAINKNSYYFRYNDMIYADKIDIDSMKYISKISNHNDKILIYPPYNLYEDYYIKNRERIIKYNFSEEEDLSQYLSTNNIKYILIPHKPTNAWVVSRYNHKLIDEKLNELFNIENLNLDTKFSNGEASNIILNINL